MDWFTILLIFIFFILPLIQQVLEANKKRNPEIEMEEDTGVEEWEIEGTVREDTPARVAGGEKRTASGGWSEGWGSWDDPEKTQARSPASPPAEQQPQARPKVERTEQPAWGERPERAQRPAPVQREERPQPIVLTPLPEPTTARPVPDRMRRAAPAVPGPQGRNFSPRRPPPPIQPVAVVASRRGAPDVADRIRDRDELRKAIVLNEILGPPRSLRELG
jgi:hypothetical protein